jgi:hypothetical protein
MRRRQRGIRRRARSAWRNAWVAAALLCVASRGEPAFGKPLDQAIPGLFGGVLATTIDRGATLDLQQVQVAERFRGLSAALAAARSQSPVPSASGAFRFAWDPELDTFVRYPQSLGSAVAERAQTLGRGTWTVAVSYTHIDFDTLEGDDLDDLRSSQPALSADFVAQLPPADQARFGDDILQTRLDLQFAFDLFYLSTAYGVTDTIDVSLALSLNRARMKGSADAIIIDPQHNGRTLFSDQQVGLVTDPAVCDPFTCAQDGFDDSAFGTGDLFLRAKWNFVDTEYVDFATVGVLTLPTGNAEDFLGFHDVTFTPWLVASKAFGRVSPHVNLGYAFRSSQDVSQAQWIVGADTLATGWLTLTADFLGFHDNKRDGVNDDVVQSALGFKLHPFGQLVLAGGIQLPVNRDGLRADIIYTGQLEYTF